MSWSMVHTKPHCQGKTPMSIILIPAAISRSNNRNMKIKWLEWMVWRRKLTVSWNAPEPPIALETFDLSYAFERTRFFTRRLETVSSCHSEAIAEESWIREHWVIKDFSLCSEWGLQHSLLSGGWNSLDSLNPRTLESLNPVIMTIQLGLWNRNI